MNSNKEVTKEQEMLQAEPKPLTTEELELISGGMMRRDPDKTSTKTSGPTTCCWG